jgi:hypothetical protein
MLYNGMERIGDPGFVHGARVGLLELDRRSGRVLARSTHPVLTPPPGSTITFAASIAAGRLYYTVDDSEIWAARLNLSDVGLVEMTPESLTPDL